MPQIKKICLWRKHQEDWHAGVSGCDQKVVLEDSLEDVEVGEEVF